MSRFAETYVRVQNREYDCYTHINIWQKDQQGRVYHAKPIEMELTEDGSCAQSSMVIHAGDSKPFLNQLMNELWNLGIRPANGKIEESQFSAMNEHIKDLRRIAFEPPKHLVGYLIKKEKL